MKRLGVFATALVLSATLTGCGGPALSEGDVQACQSAWEAGKDPTVSLPGLASAYRTAAGRATSEDLKTAFEMMGKTLDEGNDAGFSNFSKRMEDYCGENFGPVLTSS